MKHLVRTFAALVTVVAACSATSEVDPNLNGRLAIGTWGGDTGGFIVGDTSAHLHVGCTFGDIRGRIALDVNGNFSVAGSYMLRAYPVQVGPSVPATFTGHVKNNVVVVTATVNDTTTKTTVVRGPVTLTLGVDPRLGPCPICRRPIISRSR